MSIARARTVIGSLYGLMRNALGLNVATPLGSQELSCTVAPDRRLVVLGHEPIAGFARDLGTVANEAAMLALHTLDSTTPRAEPTFVAAGDSVLRTDDPGWRWHCISGHGQTLSDWERRPLAGALEGLAVTDHTHAISTVTGLVAALGDLEPALGQPLVDGMLLSSTAAGDRSWIVPPTGAVGGSGGYIGEVASVALLLSGEHPVGTVARITGETMRRLYYCVAEPTDSPAAWWRLAATVASLGAPRWIRLVITASPGGYVELIALRYRIGGLWYPDRAMTTDTEPAPLVASATQLLGGYSAYLAFDQAPSTRIHTNGALPCSVTVFLGEVDASMPDAVGITPGWYSADRVPRNFSVEVSATGAFAGEQTTVYSATGQTYTPSTERIFSW